MKTGFDNLDKLINLRQPGVILLTGAFAEVLSGDIANNICLKQNYEVLEIVSHKKEYLIKRLLVNKCNVDYKKWTLKNEYTEKELQEIGQATVNLVEVTNRLPTIIEQEMNLYNLKKVTKLVSNFANIYADGEEVSSLVVLDIFPLNTEHIKSKKYIKNIIKLFKDIDKVSKKLNVPIIIVYNMKYNEENSKTKYIEKQDIGYIKKINKYINKTIIVNLIEKQEDVYNLDIYDINIKIGTAKLKYDFKCRRFIN